jgi:hypothetical protein
MIKYYPSFKVKTNLKTNGNEYALNGVPYKGDYYATYDNKVYSGADPIVGPSEELIPITSYAKNSTYLAEQILSPELKDLLAKQTNLTKHTGKEPLSYFPKPTQSDYDKGYIIRYFIKKINSKGFVTEISPEEYDSFLNGTVLYDVSFYLVQDIFWKLTGNLNTKRYSQYDIREGIIDTNKRLVEAANIKFIGLVEFIGGEYAKFAIPTS